MQFKTFGEWLRHYRLQKEISPFKMTEALGYKRVSAIYNFEYGIAPLPITKWRAMAAILQLPIEEFLKVMERYSPEKVAEFRLIRGTALSLDGAVSKKVGDHEEDHFTVVAPTSVLVADDRLRTYQLADTEAALVTQEPWEDSLILAVDQLRRRQGQKLGLLQVSEAAPFPAAAVVSTLKEAKTVCVLELGDEGEPSSCLADRLKAAFLDALTGAEGFPMIHRVPKVFSVVMQPFFDDWTAEKIEEILNHLQENSRQRYLAPKASKSFSDSIKSR